MAELRSDYLPDDRDVSLDYGTSKTFDEFRDKLIECVKSKLDGMGFEYKDIIAVDGMKNNKPIKGIGVIDIEDVDINMVDTDGDALHGSGMARMPVDGLYDQMCTLTFNDSTGWSEDSFFDEHSETIAEEITGFLSKMREEKAGYKVMLANIKDKQYILDHVYAELIVNTEIKDLAAKSSEFILMPMPHDNEIYVKLFVSDPVDSEYKIPISEQLLKVINATFDELFEQAKINLNNHVIKNLKINDVFTSLARLQMPGDAPDFMVDAVAETMRSRAMEDGEVGPRMMYTCRLHGLPSSSILLSDTAILMMCKFAKIKEEFVILPTDRAEDIIFVPNDDGEYKLSRKEIVDAVKGAESVGPFHDPFTAKALRYNVLKHTINIV